MRFGLLNGINFGEIEKRFICENGLVFVFWSRVLILNFFNVFKYKFFGVGVSIVLENFVWGLFY